MSCPGGPDSCLRGLTILVLAAGDPRSIRRPCYERLWAVWWILQNERVLTCSGIPYMYCIITCTVRNTAACRGNGGTIRRPGEVTYRTAMPTVNIEGGSWRWSRCWMGLAVAVGTVVGLDGVAGCCASDWQEVNALSTAPAPSNPLKRITKVRWEIVWTCAFSCLLCSCLS